LQPFAPAVREEDAMNARDTNTASRDSEDTSYDDLLSPDETYEGSKHFALDIDIDVDFDTELDTTSTNKTVVMSPALLAQLRRELLEYGAPELHTRPTQRSMQAVRPETSKSPSDSCQMCSTSPSYENHGRVRSS
jgi:hypothetical protein